MDKEIRADAKLKNLGPEKLETLWRLRNPEEGGEKLTLEAIAADLPRLVGFSASLSALSDFFKWLRFKRRMEASAATAAQARLELAKDPNLDPADIERAAQAVFTAEMLEAGNVRAYVALAKLRLAGQQVDLDRRRIELLERKASQADQANEVVNSELGDGEARDRLKTIFRMG